MKKKGTDTVETPVASLIDVVFLLIIFFVVTASIETDVIDETIRLAQAKNSQGVEEVKPNKIIINIRENGTVTIGKATYSVRQLQNLLTNMRKNGNTDLEILMRCDGNVRYEHVSRTQEAITNAGYWKVKLVAIAGNKS